MSLTRMQISGQKPKTHSPNVYIYLSWRKLPAVVLFLLAIYLIATRTSKKGDSTKDIFQFIKDTCSVMPFSAPNKPEGMIVNSVFALEEFGSLDDPNVMKYFQTPALLAEERSKAYNGGMTAMNAKFMNAALAVYSAHDVNKPMETRIIFANYIERLGNLKKLHFKQTYAKKINMGYCGEHSSHAALALLQLSVKKQINIPIKIVGAGHAYVMIGSKLVDVDIEYDENSVQKYVKKAEAQNHFSTGYICDTWNGGIFSKASTNKIALYKASDIREHRVNVETFSLDFDFSLFSPETAKFFQDELKTMGLESLHGKPLLNIAGYEAETVEENKNTLRG